MDAKIVILGFRGSSFTYVLEEALRVLLLCINRFHLQLKLTAEAFGGDLRMRAGAIGLRPSPEEHPKHKTQ